MTMGFPTKNDHFGVFWGYHHFRKPPYCRGDFLKTLSSGFNVSLGGYCKGMSMTECRAVDPSMWVFPGQVFNTKSEVHFKSCDVFQQHPRWKDGRGITKVKHGYLVKQHYTL